MADPRTVKCASIQVPSAFGDPAANRQRFAPLVEEAAANGAKFIVLPETAVTGYLSQDLAVNWHVPPRTLAKRFQGRDPTPFAESIPGPSTEFFGRLAAKWGVYLTVPLVEIASPPSDQSSDASYFPKHNKAFYNSIALVGPTGAVVGHYRKNNLWPYIDNSWATAASSVTTVDTEFGRVGLAVCYDVHIILDKYKPHNLWALLYCVAWVDDAAEHWFEQGLPERVKSAGFNVVLANWSTDQEQPWKGSGFSRVYDAQGRVLAKAKTFVGTEIVYAELPVGNNTNT